MHLGHLISTDESFTQDMLLKKRELIGKVHNLRQEFGGLDPHVFIQLVKIYALHLYGCTLWDIYALEATQFWTAWHRLLKITFNLPLPTHRHLLSNLVSVDHPKKLVIKRFIKFSNILENSTNPHLQLLHQYQSRDWRSTYGRNTMNICRDAGVNHITEVHLSAIVVNPVPPGSEWRVNLLADILHERGNNSGLLSEDEVLTMLNSVCCD